MISNLSLDRDAKSLGIRNWRGVFSKDRLPNPMPAGKYIVNMENSIVRGKPGRGSHWIAVDVRPERTIYLDPFGVPAPPVIIKRSTKPFHWSHQQVEDADSKLCGWISLYFLNENSRGRSYQDILGDFAKYPFTKNNRFIIDRYFGIRSK